MRQRATVDGPRTADEDGISLVEVLIAMFLLGIALAGFANVSITSFWSLRDATDRTTANSFATRAVEAARHLNYEELALDGPAHPSDRCATGTTFVVASDGPEEDVLCSDRGGVGNEPPFWGVDGPYELQTWITAIDGFTNARRLTAVVTYEDRGTPVTVRTSTVIAQVDR